MLELQNLVWELPDGGSIINGISCKLGSRLTVITGPNGGGKTSLAKLIAGVEKPTSGRILLDGEDITDLDITGRARLGVAYAFQQPVRSATCWSLRQARSSLRTSSAVCWRR